ncbi:hypothetical protein HF086_014645 [Spodoptera exigua]|uniref:Uncharacterized protein n=1 Tax=Spodoptera exigua TaxID=7107 RepID=A0A922SB81_SPOEX|nr:hypothetical protein HF086_014645 [Spodoptera exigua]
MTLHNISFPNILLQKNGTVSERFTINTGEYDKDKMNIIEQFDGKDHLTFWGSPECNSLQINIQVRKSDMFSAVKFLPNGLILPVAWIEMSVEELPEGLRTLVYHGTYSTAAAQLGLTVICVIAFIGSGVCLLCTFARRKQKPCATLKVKIPTEIELKNQMS